MGDGRVFASYPMPPKINLSNEQPRRESLLESQLQQNIGNHVAISLGPNDHNNMNQYQTSTLSQGSPNSVDRNSRTTTTITTSTVTTTKSAESPLQNVTNQRNESPKASQLTMELAQKEARLMADIKAFQVRPYSPYQVPPKIDLSSEHTAILTQAQNSPTPRPYSQASSTRSSTIEADLLDKEAKLMRDIEELERKPFNPQQMVLEKEEWYEYPKGRPEERQLAESKRRVRDFCNLPEDLYRNQQAHIYEDNLPISTLRGRSAGPSPSSIRTAIIRQPKREIDNKSPLPFAFDNFTTKGVRGNIATVGAVEPDRPRAPIYPIMKRSPTPNHARG